MKARLANLRWKIVWILVVVGVIGAVPLSRADDTAQKAVEETRQALREQGFKTDLADFDFSTSPELRAREAILKATAPTKRLSQPFYDHPNLMEAVGNDSAIVVWKQDVLKIENPSWPGNDKLTWEEFRRILDENQTVLDMACAATLAGPIGFNLNASGGNAIPLPHLAMLKNLMQTLGSRTVLSLHDGNKDAAWTNLMASTRLVTAWEPEPAEISHLVRFANVTLACNAVWQALQTNGWSDEQLARLQQEWESVDFFTNLSETAAFKRASDVAMCRQERQQEHSNPRPTFSEFVKEAFRSPTSIWFELDGRWNRANYLRYGSYEDEKALLLFYLDRELELRNAVKAPAWVQMRQLPGITNRVFFHSRYRSRLQTMMNLHEMSMALQKQGTGLLGRAAKAEAQRRLIITAIALERFHGKNGSYPKTLSDLAPEFLKTVPVDFMDGQPLRYRLTDDGHFVLYSVGLDCVDNGGQMRQPRRRNAPYENVDSFGTPPEADLVWPRPASVTEVTSQHEQELKAKAERTAQIEEREKAQETRAEVLRQVAVKKLLAMKPPHIWKEPTYQGQPLSKILQNEKISGKTQITLDELLTVRRITTGEEPDVATFEIPISYDVVTNIGKLRLLVDAGGPEPTDSVWIASSPEVRAYEGGGELQECSRATNGNCLLAWNTTYDPPGQHVVQAQLLCTEKKNRHTFEVRGPVMPYFSTNVCQFDPFYSDFDSSGAILYAKLPESNGIYTIELKSPTGEHIKTLAGTTSNGVINVKWDLKDDHGNKCTNDSFKAIFNVTLPDSGRSQTLKGP